MLRLLIIFSLLFSQQSYGKKTLKVKNFLTSPRAHKKLAKAHKHLEKGEKGAAIELLIEYLPKTEERKGDRAQVLQTLGYAYGQSSDYRKAAKYFEEALTLEALPAHIALNLMFLHGQIRAQLGEFPKAAKILEEWLEYLDDKEVKDTQHAMIGHVYYENKLYDKAEIQIKKAIEKSKNPRESWFQFLLGIYLERKDFNKAVIVLKQMIEKYPEKEKYWDQLAAVFQRMEKTDLALIAMQLSDKQGFNDEKNEILFLASLLLEQNIPYRAAKVLEKALNDGILKKEERIYEILAQSWISAKNYKNAIKAYQQIADGEAQVKIAKLYTYSQEWNKSIEFFKKALKMGGIKDTGKIYYYLGISYLNIGQKDQAKDYFTKATENGYKHSIYLK